MSEGLLMHPAFDLMVCAVDEQGVILSDLDVDEVSVK